MVAIAFIYWDPVLVKGGTRISGRRFLPIHFSDFAFFRFRIFIFPKFFRRGFPRDRLPCDRSHPRWRAVGLRRRAVSAPGPGRYLGSRGHRMRISGSCGGPSEDA
jgi:hypothetical protein